MLRFLGLLVLISLAFAAGYVFGQLPLKPLTEKVRELSKNVMDTTLGIERDLRRRQGLVDAKARLVQAKLDLAERNYGNAGKQLADMIDAMEQALHGTREPAASARLRALVAEVKEVRLELTMGEKFGPVKLDGIQKELDELLQK
jgi:hypothetical protein